MKIILGRPGRLSALVVLGVLLFTSAAAQEAETATNDGTTSSNETPPKVQEEEPAFLAAEPDQWGTYYDPQQEFCGKYDCYRILGFDYETFGSPDTKEITKRYRRMSRKWHPDKSKHPNAKERFVVSHILLCGVGETRQYCSANSVVPFFEISENCQSV